MRTDYWARRRNSATRERVRDMLQADLEQGSLVWRLTKAGEDYLAGRHSEPPEEIR